MSMPTAVLNGRAHDGVVADDDPAARPRRRAFSAEYKLAILAEYDAAAEGEKGSILRREGLYSSHVTEWRRARDAGALSALASRTRQSTRHPAEVEGTLAACEDLAAPSGTPGAAESPVAPRRRTTGLWPDRSMDRPVLGT